MGERPGGRHCPDDTRRASQTSGLEEPVGMAASMMPVISGEIRRGWMIRGGGTKVHVGNEAICGIIRLSAQVCSVERLYYVEVRPSELDDARGEAA